MNWTIANLWKWWSSGWGLTGLLIFAVAYIFAVSAFGDYSLGALAGRIMFSLIIITGILATFKQKWLHFLVMALAVVDLGLTWVYLVSPQLDFALINAVLGMVLLVLLLAILLVQVFQGGKVTAHRIRGAIVVYLLIGGMWSFLYYIFALTVPHAFHWPEGQAPGNLQEMQQSLTYFSFITLTTTGFGDITPAIPLTRTLAMFEALTGQLYLVITLARLVSLAISKD